MKSIIATFVFIPMILFSQSRILPMPKCGWDSLKSIIQYPQIAVRAGLRTALLANIEIDSLGKMTHFSIESFSTAIDIKHPYVLNPVDSLFVTALEKALQGVKWSPGSVDGIKKTMSFEMPFIFTFFSEDIHQSQRKIIIIDAIRPLVKTDRTD